MKAAPIALSFTVFALAACADLSPGPANPGANMNRYVAMGSSLSMGVASDGVVGSGQQASWPAQLAADVGAAFGVPTIAEPGCKPPMAAPIANFRRVDGSLITDTGTCAANAAGVSLPTQNVAINGATAGQARSIVPAAGGALYARVLRDGQTQVTAMRSMTPTFVSVEFGANEIIPALAGNITVAETVANFTTNYNYIIDNGLKQVSAQAVLALLPADMRKFPLIRTAAEIASQRAAFASRNVSINANCDASTNWISLSAKVLPAIATGAVRAAAGLGPLDFSCADVPNTTDGILTENDLTLINNRVGQMNGLITNRANANGYATFSLGSLYDTVKDNVPFNLNTMLTSPTPFGNLLSLDGIHPSAAGQAVLAAAAKSGIIQKYGTISH